MVPKKTFQIFISKLKSCRSFSNSNYINNSYLNYVNINRNKKENINKEQKDNKPENGKSNEISDQKYDEEKYDEGIKKNMNYFKKSSDIRTVDKDEHAFKNTQKNDSIGDESYNDSKIKEETKLSEDFFSKSKKIKEKQNIKKECSFENSIYNNFSNRENTSNFFQEENLNDVNKKKNYINNKKAFQEDAYTDERKDEKKDERKDEKNDNTSNRKHKDIFDEENERDFLDIEKNNYMEEDEMGHSKYSTTETRNNDNINFDTNQTKNVEDIYNALNNKNNSKNDFINEKESENSNMNKTEYKKKVTSNISDHNDNYNNTYKNEEIYEENEEDIPNIFEVDENLTEEEKKEKLKLIKLITEKLAGPLKSNRCENSTKESKENVTNDEDSMFADNRPIAIEVDGPSHFYANSNRYTTYTKLKHRILTKLGYNVIHISYIDWRKLRNKSEREEFILKKLKEKNDEFLEDSDRIYYNERMNMIKEDYMKYMKQKNEKNE